MTTRHTLKCTDVSSPSMPNIWDNIQLVQLHHHKHHKWSINSQLKSLIFLWNDSDNSLLKTCSRFHKIPGWVSGSSLHVTRRATKWKVQRRLACHSPMILALLAPQQAEWSMDVLVCDRNQIWRFRMCLVNGCHESHWGCATCLHTSQNWWSFHCLIVHSY